MINLYIKVGSITNAQRGQRLLRAKGYKAQIKRVEKPTDDEGCGYLLAVKAENKMPVDILSSNGIEIRGVEKR